MKWMLIVVGIFQGNPEASYIEVYDTMELCFAGRDVYIWEEFNDKRGTPPTGYQVLCLQTDQWNQK